MPTKTAGELFEGYRKDWEAALCPCVGCLLESCPAGERDALQVLLEHYMDSDAFGTPPYSPVQQRRLMERVAPLVDRVLSDPGVMAEQDQLDAAWRDTPWLVRRWRRAVFGWFCWRLRWEARRSPKRWE